MYVIPEARGRGVARILLAALEDRARGLGYTIARLDTGPKQPRRSTFTNRPVTPRSRTSTTTPWPRSSVSGGSELPLTKAHDSDYSGVAVVRSTWPSATAVSSVIGSAGIRYRYTSAASTAPTGGATMKSQTCFIASPPTMIAGPKLRAGLTEVPSSGIPTRCTTSQTDADRQAGEPRRADPAGGDQHHEDEHEGEDDLGRERTADADVDHARPCPSRWCQDRRSRCCSRASRRRSPRAPRRRRTRR